MIQLTLPDHSHLDVDPPRICCYSRMPEDPFTLLQYDGDWYQVNETPEEIGRRIRETNRCLAVECRTHGSRISKCFLQDNGDHLIAEKCSCVRAYTRLCKVDAHRQFAANGGVA